jgi:hypothetical protein
MLSNHQPVKASQPVKVRSLAEIALAMIESGKRNLAQQRIEREGDAVGGEADNIKRPGNDDDDRP